MPTAMARSAATSGPFGAVRCAHGSRVMGPEITKEGAMKKALVFDSGDRHAGCRHADDPRVPVRRRRGGVHELRRAHRAGRVPGAAGHHAAGRLEFRPVGQRRRESLGAAVGSRHQRDAGVRGDGERGKDHDRVLRRRLSRPDARHRRPREEPHRPAVAGGRRARPAALPVPGVHAQSGPDLHREAGVAGLHAQSRGQAVEPGALPVPGIALPGTELHDQPEVARRARTGRSDDHRRAARRADRVP